MEIKIVNKSEVEELLRVRKISSASYNKLLEQLPEKDKVLVIKVDSKKELARLKTGLTRRRSLRRDFQFVSRGDTIFIWRENGS